MCHDVKLRNTAATTHAILHTSHLTPHTSHLTPHTLQLTLYISRLVHCNSHFTPHIYVPGGTFGAVRCTQAERKTRNILLAFDYNFAYCGSRTALLEGMRIQDGPDSAMLSVEFPDDKKKQFASRRDQMRQEKTKYSSPDSASSTCKKHNWVPHIAPNVVRVYLLIELNCISVTKSI
jgi:hypothetical protein